MVQASSGEPFPAGMGDALRIFPKIVGTLVVSAVAVIVMVDVAVAPEANVTLAGANAHEAPSGNAEQASETGPIKPPVEVRVIG
jgi:hypothetical protein